MTFIWPELLWLLFIAPILIGIYFFLLYRKRKATARFAGLLMVQNATSAGSRVRRIVPPLLMLLAVIALIISIARPAAVISLPTQHETIILAIDVSGSMRATDVQPSRIEAAQEAARKFILDQPSTVRIGVVTFAGAAAVAQYPTQNRDDVLAAIDRFELQRATAIGSGILVSLKVLFPTIEFDLSTSNPRKEAPKGPQFDQWGNPIKKFEMKPVPPGSYDSAVIVLLTDGQTTAGPDPIESAKMAAERGVRVYTVGIGTPGGEILNAGGMRMRVKLDEDALKQIAAITHGEFFFAGSAPDLKKIYQSLSSRFTTEKRETEVSAFFVGGALLLALLSAMLSMAWFNRIL
jgi:Ca-activated chloride channel homolog